MPLTTLAITFFSIALCISAIYILLLSGKEDRFLQYWAFSWIAYSFSVLCAFLYINNIHIYIMGMRDVFDLVNIFCLMLSAYSFSRMEVHLVLKLSAVIVGAWGVIGTVCNINLLYIFVPISIFECVCTIVIINLVMRHWPRSATRREFASLLFFIWGFGKAISSIIELIYQIPDSVFLMEVLFSNLLNYAIIIIFMHSSVELLTRSQEEFRIIADNASDIVFLYELKPQSHYAYVTPSVEEITGYRSDAFTQNEEFLSELVSPDDRDNFLPLLNAESYMDEDVKSLSLIFSFMHRNGTPVWAEIKTTLIEEKGQPFGIVGIVRDISMLKNAEQELIDSKQTRDKLLSNISHELRLPMTAIVGYIEALRDGVIQGKDARIDALNTILDKALSLNHLINDLFSLSRFESNQVSMNLKIEKLVELSDFLAKFHEEKSPPADVSVATGIDNDKLAGKTAIIDRDRINQVVSNLVANAKKFSDKDSEIKVFFETDDASENYMISVVDKGIGISKEDLPNVFERFYSRGLSTQGNTGTGLGLTLSKEIVEAHKGKLFVESTEGEGSTFTVSLPLYLENS